MNRTLRRLDLASEILLMALVLATPLAFGSVEVWAQESMKAGILLFVVLRLVRRLAGRRHRERVPQTLGGAYLVPVALFVALGLLQIVPMPAAVIERLSPRAHEIYQRTVPGYAEGSNARDIQALIAEPDAPRTPAEAARPASNDGRPWRTLSIAPQETREKVFLIVAYVLLFLGTIDLAASSDRRIRLLVAIALTGFGIASFALIQKLTWNGSIFWIREAPRNANPFGPFINPNHFAGYMELVLPVAIGLLLTVWRSRRAEEASDPAAPGESSETSGGAAEAPADAATIAFPRLDEERRVLFAGWGDSAFPKTALFAVAMTIAILAILASRSLGGLLATFITFALFGWLLAPAAWRRRVAGAGLALVAVLGALTGAALAGAGPLEATFRSFTASGSGPSFLMRWTTWARSLELISDFPLVGSGLGTFHVAYGAYFPAGVHKRWYYAHNDYVHLLAEAGLIGFGLFVAAVLLYGRRVVGNASGRRTHRELTLGVILALVSIAIHSVVDFNLQIPSNGFLAVLLAGVLAAAVPARRRASRGESAAAETYEPGGIAAAAGESAR